MSSLLSTPPFGPLFFFSRSSSGLTPIVMRTLFFYPLDTSFDSAAFLLSSSSGISFFSEISSSSNFRSFNVNFPAARWGF